MMIMMYEQQFVYSFILVYLTSQFFFGNMEPRNSFTLTNVWAFRATPLQLTTYNANCFVLNLHWSYFRSRIPPCPNWISTRKIKHQVNIPYSHFKDSDTQTFLKNDVRVAIKLILHWYDIFLSLNWMLEVPNCESDKEFWTSSS